MKRRSTSSRIKDAADALRFIEIILTLAVAVALFLIIAAIAGSPYLGVGASIILFVSCLASTILLHAIYCFLYGFSDMLKSVESLSREVHFLARSARRNDAVEPDEADAYGEYNDE